MRATLMIAASVTWLWAGTVFAAAGGLPVCTANLNQCTTSLDACTTSLTGAQASLATCIGNLSTCDSNLSSCTSDLNTCTSNLANCTAARTCGNGVLDPGEDCELGTLNGASCSSLGFACGSLACTPGTCTFDTSACQSGKLVFITSVEVSLTGGLAQGDQICNSLAANAGRSGTYVAWLSTSSVNAVSRLTPGSGPFRRPDCAIVANDIAQLTSGITTGGSNPLANPIILTEGGMPVGETVVWTGTSSDGTASGYDCAGWTSTTSIGSVSGTLGDSSNADCSSYGGDQYGWTHCADNGNCGAPQRLYCFEL